MADKPTDKGVAETAAPWRGAAEIRVVSSSEFTGRFGHWAFEAQTAPVRVVNNKTSATLDYFVSAREFSEFIRLRDRLPRAMPAWEMSEELIRELEKPLPEDYPDLNHLLDE